MLGDNQGTFFARVFAVAANSPQVGKRSQPSNTIQYTVSSLVYWTNQNILDGAVNGTAWLMRTLSLGVNEVDVRVVDGAVNDVARGAVLKASGFQVLRIANRDVTREQLESLLRAALKNSHFVPPLPKGEGDRG